MTVCVMNCNAVRQTTQGIKESPIEKEMIDGKQNAQGDGVQLIIC